jgi:hypothetical protein
VQPVELVQRASPLFNNIGWRYYFDPATLAAGWELGLRGRDFYFIGRGGVLGNVEWPVVHSAFGYFKASYVEERWNRCRQIVAPRDAARAHLACCAQFGRVELADIAGLERFCAAAEAVLGAAQPAALALFAGYLGEPVPGDPPARAMHLATVLRELRGSAHLVAVVAAGITPLLAHFVKRPDALGIFGWDPDDTPTVGDAERRRMAGVESATDRLLGPAFGAVDQAGAADLLDGLQAINDHFPDA